MSAATPGSLLAQESVFGMLGFGVPDDGLSVRSRGMGNASTSLPGVHFTFRNPAALGAFDRTGITVAGTFATRTPEDAVAESRQNSAEVPLVQLAFPVGAGFVLGGGYYRYLDFDGFVDTTTPFEGDSLPLRLSTEGGVSVLSPQLAHWFSPALRVGAAADFYTGSRQRRRRVEFDPDLAVPTADSLEHDFHGAGFTVGAQASPFRGMLLGAAYRSGTTLKGELEVGDDDGDGDSDGSETSTVEVELPETFYAGASYRMGSGWLAAAEVEASSWGGFTIDGEPQPEYDDVVGFGVGLEYSFPRRLFFLPEGTVVRAGARTRTLPQRFDGERVRERALSVGLGQIVGIGASNLDLALEVGRRGSLDRNGIAEGFARLGVSLSAFEQWASRDRPEGR